MINRRRGVRLGAAALGLTLFAALLILLADPFGGAPAEPPPPTPVPTYDGPLDPVPITGPGFESLSYGIQAFLWWDASAREFDLDLVEGMGFTHVKQMFTWLDVMPFPDSFDWQWSDQLVDDVTGRGLGLVARLDHPPGWALVDPARREDNIPFDVEAYARYCGALADRYQGRIAAYQVWNEPNLDREWAGYPPDAAGYVRMLGACYTAIKAADPEAIVISAGLAPTGTNDPLHVVPDVVFLQQMFDAGLSEVYDVLGVHAPGFDNPPWVSADDIAAVRDGHRWMAFRHVEDIRRLQIANGDAHKQVAILEFGWHVNPGIHPDYAWYAVTNEQQADYLVGAYRFAAEHWRPWAGLMSMIYIAAPEWTEQDEQYWWSISLPGYGPLPRPAYWALANMEKVVGDRVIPARSLEEEDDVSLDTGR